MPEEFRAIRPDEFEECLDLWGRVFEETGREYFIPYFHGDPAFRLEHTRVCLVDGRLVGAVQICERRIRIGGSEIVMGGIANVATFPEYRGRGYSSRLLEDAARVMLECGMDHSVLFTGIHSFYEKLGWRTVPAKMLAGRLKDDLSEAHDDGCSIRPCDWASDMADIRKIYEAYNSRRTMTCARAPEYWTGYVLPRAGTAVVAESGGRIVGYIFFALGGEECSLKEIGCLPGHEACADSLIRYAACSAGAKTIRGNLPEEPEIVDAIGRIAEHIEPRISDHMMCRIVDMHLLGERILPELNRRAQESSLTSGSISLDTEQGSLALSVKSGQVALGADDPARIRTGVSDFFSLLFGLKEVDEAGLSMTDEARQIVSALFPAQRAVLWPADSF